MMSASAMGRFDLICKAVAARGRGLSLTQIGDASTLARELSRADSDMTKVATLRVRLGLEAEELDWTDAAPLPTA